VLVCPGKKDADDHGETILITKYLADARWQDIFNARNLADDLRQRILSAQNPAGSHGGIIVG